MKYWGGKHLRWFFFPKYFKTILIKKGTIKQTREKILLLLKEYFKRVHKIIKIKIIKIKSHSKAHVIHLELLPKMRMPETRSQGTFKLPPLPSQACEDLKVSGKDGELSTRPSEFPAHS